MLGFLTHTPDYPHLIDKYHKQSGSSTLADWEHRGHASPTLLLSFKCPGSAAGPDSMGTETFTKVIRRPNAIIGRANDEHRARPMVDVNSQLERACLTVPAGICDCLAKDLQNPSSTFGIGTENLRGPH